MAVPTFFIIFKLVVIVFILIKIFFFLYVFFLFFSLLKVIFLIILNISPLHLHILLRILILCLFLLFFTTVILVLLPYHIWWQWFMIDLLSLLDTLFTLFTFSTLNTILLLGHLLKALLNPIHKQFCASLWEISSLLVKSIVVLSTHQQLALLISQVLIRVHPSFPQNLNIFLQLLDLLQVMYKSFGYLFNQ